MSWQEFNAEETHDTCRELTCTILKAGTPMKVDV